MRHADKLRLFLSRLLFFEYWPYQIFYLPTVVYGLYLSARARSMMYFTAVNPCMENSGVAGFSKFKILQHLPQAYVPKTVFLEKDVSLAEMNRRIAESEISFPFILKPDQGERGKGVELIENDLQLRIYHGQNRCDFMVQEYVDHREEMGVFYYRHPEAERGTISSVVYKKYLSVKGDGRHTLQQLVLRSTRASIRYDYLKNKYAEDWFAVLPIGEERKLEPIGNHMRGTEFLDGSPLINDQLLDVFEGISRQIDGFYYGRFDLKVPSFEDLYRGQNIAILELNGVSAEPAHIFARNVNLLQAYAIVHRHMKVIFDIGTCNHRKGVPYMKFWKFMRILRTHLKKEPTNLAPGRAEASRTVNKA